MKLHHICSIELIEMASSGGKIECVTRGYRIHVHVYEDIYAGAMGKELVLLREATNVTNRYEARNHHWTLTRKDF